MKSLPLCTAYTAWTGIDAAGSPRTEHEAVVERYRFTEDDLGR